MTDRGSGKYDFLEDQEFYEVMQAYRHVPITDQRDACHAFENVKRFIRTHLAAPAPSGSRVEGKPVPTYYVRHPDETYSVAEPQPKFGNSEQVADRCGNCDHHSELHSEQGCSVRIHLSTAKTAVDCPCEESDIKAPSASITSAEEVCTKCGLPPGQHYCYFGSPEKDKYKFSSQTSAAESNSVTYPVETNAAKCPTCHGYHYGGCHRATDSPVQGTEPWSWSTLDILVSDFAAKSQKYAHDPRWLSHYFREKIAAYAERENKELRDRFATEAEILRDQIKRGHRHAESLQAQVGQLNAYKSLAEEEARQRQMVQARVEVAEKAIRWALGEEGDFRERIPGESAYWWRIELRERAALRGKE